MKKERTDLLCNINDPARCTLVLEAFWLNFTEILHFETFYDPIMLIFMTYTIKFMKILHL